MTERERLYELIVDADNEFFRETPYGTAQERIEKTVEHLLANGVILPLCKVGDYVKFTDSDEIWRVDCLHFYREGVPQISITRENVTHTVTPNMFVNSGGKVICRKQEVKNE